MKRAMCIMLVIGLLALPAHAIFGFGDLVFDPWNEIHFIGMISQLATQIGELQQQIQNQIQQITLASKHFDLATFQATYLTARLPNWITNLPAWKPTAATDTFGRNSGYLAAINGGFNAVTGYINTVEALAAPGGLRGLTRRIQDHYASLERSEGSIEHSMQIIGAARANEPYVRQSLNNLQSTVLSPNTTDNTEAAQLNAISAATFFSAQNSQNTNDAVLATLELATHDQEMRRMTEVQAINDEIYRQTYQKAFDDAVASQTTSAYRSLRIP